MAAVAKSDKSKRPTVPPPRVLIVDDEPNLLEVIGDVVGPRGMGCKIISAANIAQAKKVIATQGVDLMVADVHLPDGDGMTLLPTLRHFQPFASAIVMTGSVTGLLGTPSGGDRYGVLFGISPKFRLLR